MTACGLPSTLQLHQSSAEPAAGRLVQAPYNHQSAQGRGVPAQMELASSGLNLRPPRLLEIVGVAEAA